MLKNLREGSVFSCFGVSVPVKPITLEFIIFSPGAERKNWFLAKFKVSGINIHKVLRKLQFKGVEHDLELMRTRLEL